MKKMIVRIAEVALFKAAKAATTGLIRLGAWHTSVTGGDISEVRRCLLRYGTVREIH